MTGKLLGWIGAAAVLGCLGLGVGCLMVVKDRVRIVVAGDEPATGPDPIALLRDDVASLNRQLDELRGALGGNFEKLGQALDERAAARHGEVATAAELAAVRQLLGEQAVRLDRVATRLAEWSAPAAAQPSIDLANTPPADHPADPPVTAAVVATTPAPAPPPPAPKASFLSFSVPSTTFRFAGLQTYALVPDLCRVGFDAKSTLHDFTGVTSQVAGSFTADLADPQGAWRGEVTCEAKQLHTGVEGRDTNMWEYLGATDHPQIGFAIEGFRPAANGIDAAAQTAHGEVYGKLTIRGTTRDVAMPIELSVDPQKRVVVAGEMPLKLSDYQVTVPSQLGVISMQDEVKVWIALRARAQRTAATIEAGK